MAEITDFSGQIPLFLESFLSRPASALPKGAFWVVDFEGFRTSISSNDPNNIIPALITTSKLEPGNGWDIESGLNTLVYDNDYNRKGCLFCQAVSIPGEQTIVNPEGIQKNHFIRTVTGDGRTDQASTGLKMVFLDTNVSFVDNVIRPWVVTTARLGLIARPPGPTNYRQNISVYKLGVLTPDKPPFVLQKYTFFGACAVDVSAEEYNYNPASAPVNREATFIFHRYELETNKNNLAIKNNTQQPLYLSTKNKNINVVVKS
jgi:hypothetical protein